MTTKQFPEPAPKNKAVSMNDYYRPNIGPIDESDPRQLEAQNWFSSYSALERVQILVLAYEMYQEAQQVALEAARGD